MAFNKLNPAIQYRLMVTDVEPPKGFRTAGQSTKFSYKITFQDSYGYKYRGEYLCEMERQSQFEIGKTTVFRVVLQHDICDQIAPSPDQSQEQEKLPILSAVQNFSSGDPLVLSLKTASELICAEKENSMQPLQEHDVERMLEYSDKIHDYLLTRIAIRMSDSTGI